MGSQQNPELQRVLAALNGYSSPQPPDISPGGVYSFQSFQGSHGFPSPSVIPGLGFLPPPIVHEKPITPPPVLRQQIQPQQQQQQQRVATPRLAEARSQSSTPSVPDASTITTWPAALKHVTRHLVPNEQAAARIVHLISEQHKHERQWWRGREAIVARQEGRSGTSQQVSSLLKSLGVKDVPVALSDPESNQAELDAYDRKVHAGLVAMAADFDKQLRALGVPFYAIKHELVILEEGPEKAGTTKGRIDKGELRELQKRMLQTLEDLLTD